MKSRICFITMLILLLTTISLSANTPQLDYIHYQISGGGSNIENINLLANYDLNHINSFDLFFIYDSNNINFEGSWLLNFYRNNSFAINLELALALGINQSSSGRGFGISSQGSYKDLENYYAEIKYYFNKENPWVMKAGITLPLISSSELTLGISNSYWSSDYLLNLGIRVDL